jgi:branched-chain amino acid transport system substrate-binding protein
MTGRRAAAVVGMAVALGLAGCSTIPGGKPATQAPQPIPALPAPVAAQTATVKAALLLPLSGPRGEIGQQLLNAAQMALFDMAADDFELVPHDTKGTPQGAANAARQAAAEGAKVMLGPLFAQEVQAVKPVAAGAGVQILSFSTDKTVAGGGAHLLGFVPADQIGRVAGYAGSRGIKRFAVAAPRNEYGDAVVAALQASAQRQGAQISSTERYDAAALDFAPVAQAIAKAPLLPQAVLIADSADRSKQFAAALAAAGLDLKQVRLLGTGQWDVTGLGQDAAMAGAWFAAADPARRAQFEAQYEKLYGRKPPRLATLAYDATALAATLARLSGPNGLSAASLMSESGFEGFDGPFRLRPDGVSQRSLAVMEITPTGTRILDPAPPSFEVPAF